MKYQRPSGISFQFPSIPNSQKDCKPGSVGSLASAATEETGVLSPFSESEGSADGALGGQNRILQSIDLRPLIGFDRMAANFLRHVDTSAGPRKCWPWTGCLNSKGYGVIGYRCADGVDRRFLAHRIAWMLSTGQALLPEVQIMHRCDNRPCCNPRCLFPGTQSDNMQDALRKGRMYVGELNPNYRHGRYVKEPA